MMQEFTQQMKNLMKDTIQDIHTAMPGKIVSFDPDKCEASVLPGGKWKKPNGETMDFPQISGVPVYFPQGAGQTATIAYPVKPGDGCILLFAEQSLDTWKAGTKTGTDLRFDLTNAIAIVGLFVRKNPLVKEACDNDALILDKDGERMQLKKGATYIRDTAGQSIILTPSGVNIIANSFNVMSAGDVKINAGGTFTFNGASVNTN